MTFILKIIAKIRLWLEPVTWKLWGIKNPDSYTDLGSWEECKNLSINEFSDYINNFPYKWDKIRGLLDCSLPFDQPQVFFKNLDSCRDCDDFARIWAIWCNYHRIECSEWIVIRKDHPFTNSHFVSILHDDNGYKLLNYRSSFAYHPMEIEALQELRYNYPDDLRIQCKYKEYKV